MAKKLLNSQELQDKFNELSAACDAALNAHLPIDSGLERKTAFLLGRSPAFIAQSRPHSEQGRWVIAVARKIHLLKDFEGKAKEIAKLKMESARA